MKLTLDIKVISAGIEISAEQKQDEARKQQEALKAEIVQAVREELAKERAQENREE